jgi:hypothetical protein
MQAQEMPKEMRVTITILFSVIAILLSVLVIDKVFSDTILFVTKSEIKGIVDNKYQTHGKDGNKYFIKYHFTINNTDYKRTWFFGTFEKYSQVQLSTYNDCKTGSDIQIVYAKITPKISALKDLSHERSYLIWQLLGIVIFGGIVINELRNYINKRKSV